MKKTALDDGAEIYQKREEKTEKEKWKHMDGKARLQYFVDYYLAKLIVAVIIVGVGASLLWHFFKPKDETVLYAAVIDESLDAGKLADMTSELEKICHVNGKHQKVKIDDSFYLKDQALTRLEVSVESKQVDVIIADQKTFKKLAGNGYFESMDKFAKDHNLSGYENLYVYANGHKDTDSESSEDDGTAKGESLPYGIDLSGAEKYMDMTSYGKHPVFAVAANAPHEKNTVKFLNYLMQEK